MPVHRNVDLGHHSGRLGKRTPVIYDGYGWTTSKSINYVPNGGPWNDSMLQYPASFPQFDRQYSHYQPCTPPDGPLYHPSTINISYPPPPREGHPRRRESDYIPRPRNAFIIFRSSYISAAADEGHNELNKQARKVWNAMTEIEKGPFNALADFEKKRHQTMYPDYIYCPAARRKSAASTKKAGTSGLTPTNTHLVSSKSTAPEIPSAAPTLRPPRATAQLTVQRFLQFHSTSPSPLPPPDDFPIQESLEDAYPELKFPAKMDVTLLEVGTQASEPITPMDDYFVPTADIPELELTPSRKEEPEHIFNFSMQPAHLNRIPEQFEFYPNKSTPVFAHLPPMPNLIESDAASVGDAPPSCSRTPSSANFSTTSVPEDISECYTIPAFWWLTARLNIPQHPAPFPPCSRTLSPANFLTTTMERSTSVVFSTNDNAPDCGQKLTNDLAAPRQPVPGFIWSLDNDQDDFMSSEDAMLEEDISFMSSLFHFDSPQ